jgi:hypothetical protein
MKLPGVRRAFMPVLAEGRQPARRRAEPLFTMIIFH